MKEFKIDFTCPTWAVCYFMYNESDGLNEQEKEQADKFYEESIEKLFRLAGEKLPVIFHVDDESEFFTHNPAFGLSATCCECSFIMLKSAEK